MVFKLHPWHQIAQSIKYDNGKADEGAENYVFEEETMKLFHGMLIFCITFLKQWRNGLFMINVNYFMTNFSNLIPPENRRKPKVFWCFQGV